MNEKNKEKMLNLLADQAVFGLSAGEADELERLRREFPEFKDDYSFELAAAAVNLSNLRIDEPLPAHLQAKILDDAAEFFAPAQNRQSDFNYEQPKSLAGVETVRSVVETDAPKTPWWNWLGWGIAAAACAALAFNLWTTRIQTPPPSEIVGNPSPVQTPTPALIAAQERERLLASGQNLVQTSWTEPNPKAAKQISGDVVWSNAEQKGYLRFQGLPANDASKETYQLWIFDENQSDKTPIDGGVFDVTETGEVVIPIDAKIKVKTPKMFAVTVEKPGGVVVSSREKLVAIAKV